MENYQSIDRILRNEYPALNLKTVDSYVFIPTNYKNETTNIFNMPNKHLEKPKEKPSKNVFSNKETDIVGPNSTENHEIPYIQNAKKFMNTNSHYFEEPTWKWPDRTVPYIISKTVSENLKSTILEGVNLITSQTKHIKIIPKAKDHQDYIKFKKSKHGNYTYGIGYHGGEHEIFLDKLAVPGNVAHEIMHVLGFKHEQCRCDRDNFILIDAKVQSNHNYSDKTGFSLGPFDPDSIMMYSSNYIKALDPKNKEKMGQRAKLSEIDLQSIKYVYSKKPPCTFDCFGDKYFEQIWYECIDCWGEGTSYGCCPSCVVSCHGGHNIKEHAKGEFVCDCGRNQHEVGKCTRVSTKNKYVKQQLFICLSCFDQNKYHQIKPGFSLVVCLPCSKKCHKNHCLKDIGVGKGYCDCGTNGCQTNCKCLKV